MNANAEELYQQAQGYLKQEPPAYQQALPLLETAAQNGCADAAHLLAHCYMRGLGVEADAAASQHWLQTASAQGHIGASYNLLLMREKNGEPMNELLPQYTDLAELDYLPAQVRLMHHYAADKSPQALFWARRAVTQNHPHAQYYLAQHHQFGPTADLAAAHELYKKAAEQNLPAAHWRLGNQYQYGQATERNIDKAIEHLHKAAERGVVPAQTTLANLLLKTKNTDTNGRSAVFWYEHAAREHDIDAHVELANLYLTGQGVERDYRQAYTHAQAAAAMNQPEALRLLGDIYQYGLGLEKDPSTARHFYTQAAKYGDIPSQQKLLLAAELNHSDSPYSKADILQQQNAERIYRQAMALHYGLNCEPDYSTACQYYFQAAREGHTKSQSNLGIMYYNGQGTGKNYVQAAYWLKAAAQKNDAAAQYHLACLFKHGHGVEADIETACNWLEAAIENGYERQIELKQLLQQWQQLIAVPKAL